MLKFIAPKKKKSIGKESLLSKFSQKSSYAESYRTLRTNLHFSLMDKELGSMIITSAVQGEGKTNTVANLAYTYAQTGKSVLMVDADLRKPGLTARFGASKKIGLSILIAEALGRHLTRGKIEDYGLRDLIKLCGLQRRTCVINIADRTNAVELFFLKGKLIDIYWKTRPEVKKLANSLIKEKILTKEEAKLALGHQKKSVRRLGSILQTMGYVTEEDLNRILAKHLMEAFQITTGMQAAVFTFRNLSEDDIEPVKNSDVDFEKLYSEFLTGENDKSFIKEVLDGSIIKTEHDNLYLLPSGNIPPNPAELIGSERTSYIISLLKQKFDLVIIDTSPVLPASDALMLAPQTDGVVFVVQAGGANRKIVKDVVHQLQNSKANVLGVSINQADRNRDGYYKYYKSYYGS